MIDHFDELLVGEVAVHFNGVPKLFIHVITGYNLRVVLTQFYCQFRVAFYIKLVAKANAGKQK